MCESLAFRVRLYTRMSVGMLCARVCVVVPFVCTIPSLARFITPNANPQSNDKQFVRKSQENFQCNAHNRQTEELDIRK